MKRIAFFCGLLALFAAVHAMPARAAEFGVVLLHGKWGSPKSMQSLAGALESKGYPVSNIEQAWSGNRLYDVDYPAALKEIAAQVQKLRAQGAKFVVVAGQSMGANAAVAYAASGLDCDALVLMSPGHFPEGAMGARLRPSIERAKNMVAANKGGETESFDDTNQGRQRSLRMTAAIYVSYFDPDGLGAFTKNIARFPRPLPLLMAVGTGDPFYAESKAVFDAAPANPASRYVTLTTDHFNMPNVVADEMLKWLPTLAK